MDKFEKLVATIMKEAEEDGEPVTKEEAEEMAKMELGAKELKNYVATEKTKDRKTRERKADNDKLELVTRLRNGLDIYTTEMGGISNLEIANKEREITFSYNGFEYSVTLTKHRPPKEK